MSTRAEQIASTAEGDIGKYRDDVNCSTPPNWCAKYVSEVLRRCSFTEYDTIVTYLLNKLLASGEWTEKTGSDIQRGDIMFFDENHIQEERPLDHVVIVTGINGNTITYVDGNGNLDDYVRQRTIDKDNPWVERWVRYTGDNTFFTDKHIYDIGWPQSADIKQCIDSIVASDAGGIVIEIGYINGDGFHEFSRWADPNYNAAQAVAYAKTKTAVGVYIYNYAEFGTDTKSAIQQGLTYLTSNGVQPTDLYLGIWLDIDSEGGSGDPYLSNDVETNMINVKDFIDTCNNAGFVCAGIYAPSAVLESSKFRCDYSFNIPIWCAAIGNGTITFDQATYENLMQRFPSFTNYTKMYLYQYSWVQSVSGWSDNLDGDRQFFPIPTSGGGGGGSTVSSVTVSVIAPKRIYFSPTPGVFLGNDEFLNTEQIITITTDAENADIYYTLDGSSPYQYQRVVGNEEWQYVLSSHAVKYTEPVTIKTDTHFRVIAVPTETESAINPLLAKGSGTFLFNFTPVAYSWESEQYAYRLESDDKKIKFFEENRQAFLRYHAEETAEEIIYNSVIAVTEQATGTVQPADGDVEEGGHADT